MIKIEHRSTQATELARRHNVLMAAYIVTPSGHRHAAVAQEIRPLAVALDRQQPQALRRIAARMWWMEMQHSNWNAPAQQGFPSWNQQQEVSRATAAYGL